MSEGRTAVRDGTDRRLTLAYVLWAIVVISALALITPTLEAWRWRSVMVVMTLVTSLRCALVYAYRTQPSKLSWWLRPASPAERRTESAWLVYAVVLGIAPLILLMV